MSLAAALGMQSIKRPDGTHSYPCRARVNKEVRETPEDGEGNELSSRLRPFYLLHLYGWNRGAPEDFKGPKPSGPGLPTTKKTQSSLSYSQDLGSAGYWREITFPSRQN